MPDREIIELLRELHHDTGELRGAVATLTARVHRARSVAILMALGMATTLLLALGVGVLAVRTSSSLDCTRSWAVATSGRTSTLLSVSTARNNAADALILTLNNALRSAIANDTKALPAEEAKFLAAAAAYDKASKAYKDAIAANPVPQLPQFRCRLL